MADREFTNINGIKVCDQTARDKIPTRISQLENDSDYATITQVNQAIDNAQLGGGEVDLSGYVTKETGNASQITFADGQTFQAKLDDGSLKGEQGEIGPQGPAGADGLTTAISVNGATYTHTDGLITLPDYPNSTGGTTDLSGYYTSEEVDSIIQDYTSGKKQRYLTQAEYDLLTDTEKNDSTIIYNITDSTTTTEVDLTGYAKTEDIPTKVSQLTNDANYVNATQMNEAIANVTGQVIIEPAELDMPKVFFYGDALPTTKENVNLTMDYISNTTKFSSFVKLKCQGTSSMSYAKKNFTVAMYSDEARATKLKKDFKGWGAQSKFCLKANYVDTTHTRNISGARIAYDMVLSRPDSPFKQQLLQCPRNGAVDGFPIKLYFNGEFYGIYTWNIPKDGWMFNMDKNNPNHVVLCAEKNTDGNSSLINSCQFRQLWTNGDGNDWSVEFGTYSTDMVASFNRCINFVMTATDQEFHDSIGEYFDLYSLLDYYCFSYLCCHLDGLAKNMLMATYDGVIWGACLYDMDSIYGAYINGISFKDANMQCPEQYQEQFSALWPRIEKCFATELYARYRELRRGALSLSNIIKHVEEIYDVIPDRVLADEKAKWTSLPAINNNTMTRFRNYMRDRAVYVDAQMQEIGTNIPCTGIVLSADTLSFTTTDTQTLSVVVSPDNTTDTVTWSVSPSGVATVDNGVVTPIANGTCAITATCGSYSATCNVTVSLIIVECTGISLDKTELALGAVEGGSGNIEEIDDSQVNYLEGAEWKDGLYKISGFDANGANKVTSVTVPYAGVYKFTGTTSANISYKGLGKIDETGKIIGLYNEFSDASGTSEVCLTVTEPNTLLGVSFCPNGNEMTDDIYNSLSLKRVMTTKNVQKDVQFDVNKVGKPGWSTTTDCNIIELNTKDVINHTHIFAVKVADKIFEYPLNYAIQKIADSAFRDSQITEVSQINAFGYNDKYIELGLPTDIFGTTLDSFKEYMTTNSKTIVINPSEYLNQLNTGATKNQELLTATVAPTNCTQPVVWSVSPEGIVTVNNGLVTAVANGEATVTATCGTQSATCAVTVSGIADNNILATTTFSNGTLIALNGNVEVDTSNYYSDYIEIADASYVNVTHTGTMKPDANRLIFYDNGKKYIKAQYNGALDITAAIPANAKYMRIAFSNTVTSTSVKLFNFDSAADEYINDSVKLETHIDGTRYNEMTGAITSENGFYSMKITAPSDDNYYYLQNIASGASYNTDGAFIPGTLLFAKMDCIRLYKASKNISTIGINYSSSKTPSMKLVNDIVSSGYTETYLGVDN